MAKCDLCGGSCSISELENLRDCYQTTQVKDVCQECCRWCNHQLDEIRATNAPRMRDLILQRLNRPRSWWRRLFP